MWYAHIEKETKFAVDILSEEQYKLFIQFDLDNDIDTDDMFIPLPDEWKDVGRGIRKYKLNETGDGLIFCDELEEEYNRTAVERVVNTYRWERNILLKSTDWTQMVDVDSHRDWKAYRQWLRDFPDTFNPDLNNKGEQKIPFNLPHTLEEYRELSDR